MKRGKIKPTDTDRQPYALHRISIVILGKHIATMLRHNPYSLLRSTARTNRVERSYSQFIFFYFFCRLVSLSRVSLCVFPFLSLTLNPLNQSLNPGPEIEIDLNKVNKVVVTRCENHCQPIKPDTSCPAEATPHSQVKVTQAELSRNRWLVNIPARTATLTYDQHDTAASISLPNQTLWITVPKGAILHIDELALYHLTDDEYQAEIEISY